MKQLDKKVTRMTLSIGGMAVLVSALVGCETIERERYTEWREDAARKCTAYGGREGSQAYSDCMHRQQKRRDSGWGRDGR